MTTVMEDFMATAGALADSYLRAEPVDQDGCTVLLLHCRLCQREALGGVIEHASSCLAGRAWKLISAFECSAAPKLPFVRFVDGETTAFVEYEVEDHPWASEEGCLHPALFPGAAKASRRKVSMTHEEATAVHAAESPWRASCGAAI